MSLLQDGSGTVPSPERTQLGAFLSGTHGATGSSSRKSPRSGDGARVQQPCHVPASAVPAWSPTPPGTWPAACRAGCLSQGLLGTRSEPADVFASNKTLKQKALPVSSRPTCWGSRLVKNKNTGQGKEAPRSTSSPRPINKRNQQPETCACSRRPASRRRLQGRRPCCSPSAVGPAAALGTCGAEAPSAPGGTRGLAVRRQPSPANVTSKRRRAGGPSATGLTHRPPGPILGHCSLG